MDKNFDKIEEPLLKQSEKEEMIADHNFMFTKLSKLIKAIFQNKEKVQN